uniref:Uncharacterized protein n=1 Tax=Leersia perrieri TaxID=77586 RepID=A0A0D9V960_9ORYZ
MDSQSQNPVGKELGHVSFIFGILSLLIDLVPLFIATVVTRWQLAAKCFSPFPLILGALLNLVLAFHALFAIDTLKHKTTLFISIAGFILDSVYLFLLGLQKSTQDMFRCMGLSLMAISLAMLCVGSSVLICLIDAGFHVTEDNGKGMFWFTIAVVLATNFCSLIQPYKDVIGDGLFDREVPPCIGMFVDVMAAIDSSYFIVYALVLSKIDELLMIVSIINGTGAIIQLILLLIKNNKDYNFDVDGHQRFIIPKRIRFD